MTLRSLSLSSFGLFFYMYLLCTLSLAQSTKTLSQTQHCILKTDDLFTGASCSVFDECRNVNRAMYLTFVGMRLK